MNSLPIAKAKFIRCLSTMSNNKDQRKRASTKAQKRAFPSKPLPAAQCRVDKAQTPLHWR